MPLKTNFWWHNGEIGDIAQEGLKDSRISKIEEGKDMVRILIYFLIHSVNKENVNNWHCEKNKNENPFYK